MNLSLHFEMVLQEISFTESFIESWSIGIQFEED